MIAHVRHRAARSVAGNFDYISWNILPRDIREAQNIDLNTDRRNTISPKETKISHIFYSMFISCFYNASLCSEQTQCVPLTFFADVVMCNIATCCLILDWWKLFALEMFNVLQGTRIYLLICSHMPYVFYNHRLEAVTWTSLFTSLNVICGNICRWKLSGCVGARLKRVRICVTERYKVVGTSIG